MKKKKRYVVLLIVAVIVVIIVALVVSTISRVRKAARRFGCHSDGRAWIYTERGDGNRRADG